MSLITQLETEIDALLAQNPDEVNARLRTEYSRRAKGRERSIVLFGAVSGPATIALSGLRRIGIVPLAFTDNNQNLWNTVKDGIPVLPPAEAVEKYKDSAIFVITIFNSSAVRRQLAAMGCAYVATYEMLFFGYHEVFIPFYDLDFPTRIFEESNLVRKGFALWSDDFSREGYVSQLVYRMSLDPDSLVTKNDPKEEYFPKSLRKIFPCDTFVDCGAFDGDTIKDFLSIGVDYRKIISLEPDAMNFRRLKEYIEALPAEHRNRIEIIKMAVGSKKGWLSFESNGSMLSNLIDDSDGDTLSRIKGTTDDPRTITTRVESRTLDDLVPLGATGYIKMDIEGAEMDALKGATRLIETSCADWAITVYHRPDDLWKVPLVFAPHSSHYDFHLERYSEGITETVCYIIRK
ncbi:MAG: FkbM family methyltransferase [Opitutaceae bacterium]|jgi:FkbM family methyltransferase